MCSPRLDYAVPHRATQEPWTSSCCRWCRPRHRFLHIAAFAPDWHRPRLREGAGQTVWQTPRRERRSLTRKRLFSNLHGIFGENAIWLYIFIQSPFSVSTPAFARSVDALRVGSDYLTFSASCAPNLKGHSPLCIDPSKRIGRSHSVEGARGPGRIFALFDSGCARGWPVGEKSIDSTFG